MPPEPLPLDRKDFFKERKHERSESLGSLGGGRWRESSSHYGSRDFPRWGSADFRRPPGHLKQGGPHLFAEEPGHGYGVYRSGDKILEDENCRPSFTRAEGTYGRSNRDNRGYLILRDCRGHSWEMNNGSANVSRRLSDVNNDPPRLVDDAHAYPYNSNPDFMHTWDQPDKMGNGSATCQRCSRENGLDSIDWKTLKWNRSGSLPSRGSVLSQRSNGCVDSSEVKTDVQGKSATQVDSLSGDAACVTSAAPCEETTSRKKPRLGWGEGLAKYEKKKVEAPDLILIKDSVVVSNSVSEPSPSVGVSLVDKSPKLFGCLDCASPATPSSVACSSSPGLEDKLFGKGANVDHDVSTSSGSPVLLSENHIERLPFNLEKLNAESLATLGSSISELLQGDVGSADSTSLMSSAINKLLIWKVNISKVLETTESEIDLFETELKSLRSGLGGGGPHQEVPSSFKVGDGTNHSEACAGNANMPSHLRKVEIISPAEKNMEIQPIGNFQCHNKTRKVEDVDSPGTATSNFDEPMPLVHVVKDGACFENVSTIQSTSLEVKYLVACSNGNRMKAGGDADILGVKGSVDISVGPNQCSSISNSLYDAITAANKKLANSASEVFSMLLPKDCCVVDKLGATSDIGDQNDALMKKFASRKRVLKFRERVAAIKFRALRHLWKEDMRLLSIKKSRPKSHKKFEIGLRTSVSGYQKPRSSVRSRVAFPAGNMSLVPTSNMIGFTKKLLSNSLLTQRSTLKMPEMILDDKEKMVSRFVSNNGLVEDPLAFERERAMVNPWMSEEREIFLDKLATYGKDFQKIASFLDHKTTADCVEFYYKNHKSECFKKIMKKQGTLSVTSKLVSSGTKWNRETSDASLDILSAASVLAVQADGMSNQQKMRSGRSLLGGYNVKTLKCNSVLERSKGLVVPADERETVAADVLAGISCSFLPEGLGSCITNSIELAEGRREQKSLKVDSNMQQTLTPDVTQLMDEETSSDDSSGEIDYSDWTDGEKAAFLQAVALYGKDFAMISRCVRTKSRDQCKVFFSKARKCLGLDILHSRLHNEGSPVSHDANGGGTDAEDACAGEVGSVASTNKLGDRMEDDLPSSVKNVCDDESDPVDASHLSVDGLNKSDTDEQGEQDEDNMVSDSSTIKDSSEMVLDGDSNLSCGSRKEPCLAQAVVIKGGKEQTIEVASLCADSISNAGVDEKILVSPVTNGEVLKREEPVLGNGLYGADHNNVDAEANEVRESKCSVQYSFANGNALNLAGNFPSLLNRGPENQQNVPLEKTVAILLPKENSHSTMNSTSKNNMDSPHQLSSTLEFKESADRKSHKSVNECRKPVSGQCFAENVKPSNILQGYPLQKSINNEGNDDVSCCSSITELPFITHKVGQLSDHSTSDCQNFSDPEKTCNTGDVKLFGKILTNHSVQKSNLIKNRASEKGSRNDRNGSKSSSVKLSSHHNLDVNSAVLKFDRGNCLGLENIPIKNHGYWDGNRNQMGISSIPDSAVLLAKYPAAFGNYTTTGPRPEHSFQTVAKVAERSLGGVSSFGHREINCSNGVVDYAMYRSRDNPKLQQQFTVQDIYCEVQKRNGLEALGGGLHQHQQQGRNPITGMNGVGRPGILVGGSCAGVSDPVAAIRMHYANVVDQYGGQNGSIVRDNESWGGKGDIGGR